MRPISVMACGAASAAGLDAPSTFAAMRAAVSNFTETKFLDKGHEWIIGAQVPLDPPRSGMEKLVELAAAAVAECLAGIGGARPQDIPLALCVAEKGRPGRLDGLDEDFFPALQQRLGIRFRPSSVVIPGGHVAIVTALRFAERAIHDERAPFCVVAAADSYLVGGTLSHYVERDRVLTNTNASGFVPGEAGAALLLGPRGKGLEWACLGSGVGTETATIDSDKPLKADGLVEAVRAALAGAGLAIKDMDYHLADVCGDQYGFKQASLVVSRLLRVSKDEFRLWQVSDSVGEVGAATGPCLIGAGFAAARKGYAPGRTALVTLANDDGARGALVMRWGERT